MQSGPHPTSTDATAQDDPPDRRERARRWLLSNGLYVESLLALVVLVVGVVAAVLVVVGAILSLPTGPPPADGGSGGTSGVLDVGTLLTNASFVLGLLLGGVLLVHAVVELWTVARVGHDLDLRDGFDLAYVGVRTVQTVAAAAFAVPIVGGIALSRLDVVGAEPPESLLSILAVAGVTMLVSVLAHLFGHGARRLLAS